MTRFLVQHTSASSESCPESKNQKQMSSAMIKKCVFSIFLINLQRTGIEGLYSSMSTGLAIDFKCHVLVLGKCYYKIAGMILGG